MARSVDTVRTELDALWEHVPTAVVMVDVRQANIVRANRAAERLFGITAGAPFDSLDRMLTSESATGVGADSPVMRTLRTGETVRGARVVFEAVEGQRRTLNVTTSPISEGGRVVAAIGLFTDVTERELRDRVAREFITNAAHELQTPLAAITSAIDVLQAGAKDRPDERDRFLEHIDSATARLRRLTRALLVLSQAQAQVDRPPTEMVDLELLFRRVAAEASTGVVAVDCRAGIATVTNLALLEHVVTNLVENALKHAGTGVRLSARRTGKRVTITVGDDGPGIPPDADDRIFERFFRANPSVDGFGLGLAIVREIVEVLGGALSVDTGERGTRVSITLEGARVRRS